jgi:hypothetical protein
MRLPFLANGPCKKRFCLPVSSADLRLSGRNDRLRELAVLAGFVRGFPCGIYAG